LFYFVVLVVAADAVKTGRELYRARIETLEHTRELEREILWTSEQEQDSRDTRGAYGARIRTKYFRSVQQDALICVLVPLYARTRKMTKVQDRAPS
jgi:hypothetical protein